MDYSQPMPLISAVNNFARETAKTFNNEVDRREAGAGHMTGEMEHAKQCWARREKLRADFAIKWSMTPEEAKVKVGY